MQEIVPSSSFTGLYQVLIAVDLLPHDFPHNHGLSWLGCSDVISIISDVCSPNHLELRRCMPVRIINLQRSRRRLYWPPSAAVASCTDCLRRLLPSCSRPPPSCVPFARRGTPTLLDCRTMERSSSAKRREERGLDPDSGGGDEEQRQEKKTMGRGLLEVHLVHAKALSSSDFLGKIDP